MIEIIKVNVLRVSHMSADVKALVEEKHEHVAI